MDHKCGTPNEQISFWWSFQLCDFCWTLLNLPKVKKVSSSLVSPKKNKWSQIISAGMKIGRPLGRWQEPLLGIEQLGLSEMKLFSAGKNYSFAVPSLIGVASRGHWNTRTKAGNMPLHLDGFHTVHIPRITCCMGITYLHLPTKNQLASCRWRGQPRAS